MKKCSCKGKLIYLVVVLAVFALASLIVMLLLNSFVGAAGAYVGKIGYCQAMGLVLLCRILFGRWKIRKCMKNMCGCGKDKECGCDSDKHHHHHGEGECCEKK